MKPMNRNTEAARRAAERRQREDEAPRLLTQVPGLRSLTMTVDEARGTLSGSNHVRRIVVDRAPALFVFVCGARDCRDGGHDVTREVLQALGRGEASFEGRHTCDGQMGSAHCGSVFHYRAEAVYA